jgi:hypothetical protein
MKMTPDMHKEVIDFINTTTTEQQMFLIQAIAEKITISVEGKKGVNTHSINEPHCNIFLNGIYIDIFIQKEGL